MSIMVLGLVRDPLTGSRLTQAFDAGAEVCYLCGDFETSPKRLIADLVIAAPRDQSGRFVGAAIARLCGERPGVSVAIYVDTHTRPEDVLELGRAGAKYLITWSVDDSPVALRRLARLASTESIARKAEQHVQAFIRDPELSAVRMCLRQASKPLSATDLAVALHVSRRTASNWTSRLGLNGVRALVAACRAVVATGYLCETHLTGSQIVEVLGYSSTAHLRTTLIRYAGCAATGIRRNPDFRYWCTRILGRTKNERTDT